MRSRRRLSLLVLVVVALLALAGCDWTQPGFGPDNRSFNPVEPALNAQTVGGLHARWSVPCDCDTPLVAGGLVYVNDDRTQTRTVRAFDAATGATRWSLPLPPVSALTAVANGLAYVEVARGQTANGVPVSGQVVAYDALTGALRWAVTPPLGRTSLANVDSVLVDGPLAFVVAHGGGIEVSAVDLTGQVQWSRPIGGATARLAADPGHTVYALTGTGFDGSGAQLGTPRLVGFDETDGRIVSDATPQINGVTSSRIEFANGLVYGFQFTDSGIQGVTGAGLYALRPDTGALVWHSSAYRLWAIGADTLVGQALSDSALTGLDPAAGTVRWSVAGNAGDNVPDVVIAGNLAYEAGGTAFSISDVHTGDRLATLTADSFVHAITPAAGQVFTTTLLRLTALAPGA